MMRGIYHTIGNTDDAEYLLNGITAGNEYIPDALSKPVQQGYPDHRFASFFLDGGDFPPDGYFQELEHRLEDLKLLWDIKLCQFGLKLHLGYDTIKPEAFIGLGECLGIDTAIKAYYAGVDVEDLIAG